MADNVTFNANANTSPSDGTEVASDDVGGVQYQRVKLDQGEDGVSHPWRGVAQSTGATISQLSQTTSTGTIAASTARRGALCHNDSTASLFLAYSTAATTSIWSVKVLPSAYWEMPQPIHLGSIGYLWGSTSTGRAQWTEQG
jgi:hypothetical protein